MSSKDQISGRQVAAGRALCGVSQTVLAARANVSVTVLRRMEASGSAIAGSPGDVDAVRRALEDLGVVFLPEDGIDGAGVRLKFTRSDTRQIARLENEGGPIRDDDVP